ncbi:DnaJ-domain-containing protein [Tilletiaria anomala UBC 951]|uniref:DnaJ-domain-containing protein n=1 Tax=Tilletiaria anomala (strain ATCC 24038 / CBS 436.72 / UBC 951) TaxID=1037660 RepID=A0A066VN55_TILAU|nr:DnaJ-domain-containing protein [Tilletiaria anomala UBC 951]KDN43187.1 DnaJ-domain-containing protein [Tilletiaria anomala UBC 951]
MSEVEEALKALSLARKHDLSGNTEAALKWARKSCSISKTKEAAALLARLESRGASGKGPSEHASSSAATNGSANPAARSRSATGASSAPAFTSVAPEEKKERAYTKQQLEIVQRIRKSGGDFYQVLGVEKTVDDNGIKKAYRKLALQLHPDKNGAPGADEAFKLVSKAFTILSDPDKRGAYDRFGGDPEQRFAASSSNAAGAAGGPGMRFRGGPGMFAEEVDPQDLFNMFFGGGMGSGFGPGGATFSFGGPGMGGRTYYASNGRRARQAGARQPQQTSQNTSILLQLLPLLILGLFSLLSYAPSLFTTADPSYTFTQSGVYRDHRITPKNGVSYFVNRDSFSRHPFTAGGSGATSNGGLKGFEDRVEREWRNRLYGQCERYREHQSRRLQNTQGFFGIGADPQAAAQIRAEKYEPCERLHDFGIYM